MTVPAAALALALLLLAWIGSGSAQTAASPCLCGSLSLPFPFSLEGGECKSNSLEEFPVECDPQSGDGPLLRTLTGLYQVLEFRSNSLILSSRQLQTQVGCSGNSSSNTTRFELASTSRYVVATGNTFVTRGCNVTGAYKTDKDWTFTNCTVRACRNGTQPACNGGPCCSIPFPAGVRSFELQSSGSNGCGLSSTLVMTGGNWIGDGFSLEWALPGGGNCSQAETLDNYACAKSAVCKAAEWLDGYTCACESEFLVGDGYKAGTGCQEVDMCPGAGVCSANAVCHTVGGVAKCSCPSGFDGDGLIDGLGCIDRSICASCSELANCTNPSGDYQCVCKRNYEGDGLVNGSGCFRPSDFSADVLAGLIAGGASAGAVIALGGCCFFGRKLMIMRQERPMRLELKKLEELIQSCSGPQPAIVFPYKVIQHATKEFSESQRLGGGAFGTVYAGKLSEGTRIAVKKVNQANTHGLQQFRNEVELLAKVRHSGLVRLLGCCLEIRDPLVVYEFVANGTLREHLQQQRGKILSWGMRMKIAVEIAQALAYLHSVLSPPIFHRDVKSANILLDRSYAAKVADFGLSRLIPLGVSHVSTIAQGTPGYLDPDYYHSYQLTDKSDVYSFGVVLMELVTARKAIDYNHEQREVPLASLAIKRLANGELEQIIDPALQPTMTPESRSMIQQVAELAFRCLAYSRQDRPSMNEVADQLEDIRASSYLETREENHSTRMVLRSSLGQLFSQVSSSASA